MTERDELERIQAAKRSLHEKYANCDWFRGVGIAPSRSGLVLRLNVDPDVEVERGEIPHRYRGHDVEIVRISGYEPRGSDAAE